jgi:hypothetical protein
LNSSRLTGRNPLSLFGAAPYRTIRHAEEIAPSAQMLRYLRRVEDLTTGKLRWGMLTNGGQWRLYYQGARSVSEQFFELEMATEIKGRGRPTRSSGGRWIG